MEDPEASGRVIPADFLDADLKAVLDHNVDPTTVIMVQLTRNLERATKAVMLLVESLNAEPNG